MSCGANWHRTSCHVGQVSIGQDGIGPIDLGQIVLTPSFLEPIWNDFEDGLNLAYALIARNISRVNCPKLVKMAKMAIFKPP